MVSALWDGICSLDQDAERFVAENIVKGVKGRGYKDDDEEARPEKARFYRGIRGGNNADIYKDMFFWLRYEDAPASAKWGRFYRGLRGKTMPMHGVEYNETLVSTMGGGDFSEDRGTDMTTPLPVPIHKRQWDISNDVIL